jgi:hypothetical protein
LIALSAIKQAIKLFNPRSRSSGSSDDDCGDLVYLCDFMRQKHINTSKAENNQAFLDGLNSSSAKSCKDFTDISLINKVFNFLIVLIKQRVRFVVLSDKIHLIYNICHNCK